MRGLAPCESHVLAFVQQMRAERHDAIARLEFADDRRRVVAEAGDLHGTPRDLRRLPFDQPYARSLARIEDRADRYLQRLGGPAVRDLDGDGRAQRRVCQTALQHVASLERSGVTGLRRPTTGAVSRGPSSPLPYKLARPVDPIAGRRVSGSSMTASRRPARATRTTTWPAPTTCPGSASVSTTTPSASASRTA